MGRVFSISRNSDNQLDCRVTTPEFEADKRMVCNASHNSAPAPDQTLSVSAPGLNIS